MHFSYTKYKRFYTADFETSTSAWNVDRARVWLWDLCDNELKHKNGTDINSFLIEISKLNGCVISFHNLAYDGAYILSTLLDSDYTFIPEGRLFKRSFTTVITPTGQHFAYQICFSNGNIVTINDSLKHNSMGVRELAIVYGLPIKKGEIDYDLYREIGWKPTEEEIDYIHGDTEIMMMILKEDIQDGFDKFTESGNSKKFFIHSIANNKDEYLQIFPILTSEEDSFVRKAYRGGYCFLKEEHFNDIKGNMISLDINSMYPAAMLHRPLPYGEGIYISGKAENSQEYKRLVREADEGSPPVYVQHFTCCFNMKDGKIPTIAAKSFGIIYAKEQYIKSSGHKLCDMYLTSVDMELFFRNYKVWNITYIDAYLYRTKCGREITQEEAKIMELDDIILNDGKGALYYNYLYPWRMQKEHTTGGKRSKAKKQQNMAYGWQATSKSGRLSMPVLNERGVLTYKRYEGEERDTGYIPIAAFITAWSRKLLIDAILDNYDRFVYCDTDSLYLLGHELPNLPIHNSLYGYFKIEHYIDKAKFLGCKRYMYHTTDYSNDPNETIVKCCGAPVSVTAQMTFENFVPYNRETGEGEFTGKLSSRLVVGGKHLEETTYKLVC